MELTTVLFIIASLLYLSIVGNCHRPVASGNITIIGTKGGFIYGIDQKTLEKKWALDTGGPLLTAEQVRISEAPFFPHFWNKLMK